MWLIIKNELRYNLLYLAGLSIVMILLRVVRTSSGEAPPILLFLMFYFALQTSVMIRNQESRDRFFAQFPFSKSTLAIARLLLPLLFMMVLYFVYCFVGFVKFGVFTLYNLDVFITSMLVLFSFFSIYLMFRDVLASKLIESGFSQAKLKFFLMLVILGITMSGAVVFILTTRNGVVSPFIRTIIDFIGNNLPFMASGNLWLALYVTIVLTAGSVLSFHYKSVHTH